MNICYVLWIVSLENYSAKAHHIHVRGISCIDAAVSYIHVSLYYL